MRPEVEEYCVKGMDGNEGTIILANNPISNHRMKHNNVRHYFLRQHLLGKHIKIIHVGTEDQHTDLMNIVLDTTRLMRHINMTMKIWQ